MSNTYNSASINATVSADISITCADLGPLLIINRSDYDIYEGSYEVLPTPEGLTLDTKDKVMEADVSIKPIPYYETSNPYGQTVYIGGMP